MKKIEELGISPAPWKCATNDCGEFVGILNGRGFYVAKFAYDVKPQDARLKAAAPSMYEEGYHDCMALHAIVHKMDEGMEILNLRDTLAKMADRIEAALAKASGESEVAK